MNRSRGSFNDDDWRGMLGPLITVPRVTSAGRRRVRLAVRERALSNEDAQTLLAMLGLDEDAA